MSSFRDGCCALLQVGGSPGLLAKDFFWLVRGKDSQCGVAVHQV